MRKLFEILIGVFLISYQFDCYVASDSVGKTPKEVWKSDPLEGYNDAIRHTGKTDPNFAELRIFTKYIVSEQVFSGNFQTCGKIKCYNITELRECPEWENHLCKQVRACPGELVGCQPFTFGYVPGVPPGSHIFTNPRVKICKNDKQNAYNRYLSVVETHKPTESFDCDKRQNKIEIVAIANTPISLGARNPTSVTVLPGDKCEQCNCLCQEKEMYYVDQQDVEADTDKIVTGAKLLVQNNILRIQIEQAKLLANGAVDKDTLEWKPLKAIDETRLQWIYYEFRKFALTPIITPDDEVVTGLSFHVKPSEIRMAYLSVKTKKFDFKTGSIDAKSNIVKIGANPTKNYNLSERDASTKSTLENKPDSTDDEYVELTVTSSAKDGGQSVIPFIDTQSVTAGGPLSGASLYIRGQANFGGFLGIKLFRFNI